jgi:hypothetical protein
VKLPFISNQAVLIVVVGLHNPYRVAVYDNSSRRGDGLALHSEAY